MRYLVLLVFVILAGCGEPQIVVVTATSVSPTATTPLAATIQAAETANARVFAMQTAEIRATATPQVTPAPSPGATPRPTTTPLLSVTPTRTPAAPTLSASQKANATWFAGSTFIDLQDLHMRFRLPANFSTSNRSTISGCGEYPGKQGQVFTICRFRKDQGETLLRLYDTWKDNVFYNSAAANYPRRYDTPKRYDRNGLVGYYGGLYYTNSNGFPWTTLGVIGSIGDDTYVHITYEIAEPAITDADEFQTLLSTLSVNP